MRQRGQGKLASEHMSGVSVEFVRDKSNIGLNFFKYIADFFHISFQEFVAIVVEAATQEGGFGAEDG